jgi:K+-transporting ATPase c subunit
MLLSKARAEYEINRPKQWVILVIGLVFGVLAGIGFPYLINLVTNSLYSRKSLDNIMKTLLGSYEIEDALTDELMIVAYEYNSMRPRFYSKWFANFL